MNKTELTQEQKRIKIAEACGWKWESRLRGAIKVWNKPPLMLFHDHELPDYFNDLNAMHDAEKVLLVGTAKEVIHAINRYTEELCRILGCLGTALFQFAHATAAQRAEAFGKTLGLW